MASRDATKSKTTKAASLPTAGPAREGGPRTPAPGGAKPRPGPAKPRPRPAPSAASRREAPVSGPVPDAPGPVASGGRVSRLVGAAKGPAIAAGAAAVGFAGGAVLTKRRRQTRVLGIKLPKSIVAKTSRDGASLVKQVSEASKKLGQTSKGVSKDLERLGDQAERIGRFLE